MMDNLTFIDLVALTRITPEATVEKFGGLINSSFFDASNILGTLKQKGLVDFVTSFPSQSSLSVTAEGKAFIAEADQKATTPADTLDMAILNHLSNGKRNLQELNSELNVTQKDLAMHLYKLSKQQFLSYEIRNGNINIALTEKGFLTIKEGIPKVQAPTVQQNMNVENPQIQQAQMLDPMAMSQPTASQPPNPKTEVEMKQIEANIMKAKKARALLSFILVTLIVIVIFYLYITHVIQI